jgi:hypothetical protein
MEKVCYDSELVNIASQRNILFKDVVKQFNETIEPIGVMPAKSIGICIRRSFKPDGSYNLLSEAQLQ